MSGPRGWWSVAQGVTGSWWLGVQQLRGLYWVQFFSISSLVMGMSGQRVHQSRFADDTKLGAVLIHQGLMLPSRGTPAPWTDVLAGTAWKINKGKYEVQHWGRNNPMHQSILGANFLENTFDIKDLGCCGGYQAEHESTLCSCVKGSLWYPSLHYTKYCLWVPICCWGHSRGTLSSFGLSTRDPDTLERDQWRGTKMIKRQEHVFYGKRLRQLELFSPVQGKFYQNI